MLILYSLKLVFVGIHLRLALADLTHPPRTTETKVGETTWLNCSTNLSAPILWKHGYQHVYAGGSLIEPYLSRFAIAKNAAEGKYTLIIPMANITDAGEYKCQDDEGHGTVVSAQLIVLENDPICRSLVNQDQIIGSNDCGIEQDKIVLTCEVTFYGNIHPKMVWRRSGENNAITDGVKVEKSGKILKYILTMMADNELDNRSFVCETSRSAVEQYRCITEAIKIHLLPACKANPNVSMTFEGEEVFCLVNIKPSCSYKWLDAKNVTISNNQTLKPEKVGNYQCEANCLVGNVSYTIVAMVIEVSPKQKGGGQFLWLLLLLGVPLVVVIVIIRKYFTQPKGVKKKKENDERVSNSLLYSQDQQESKSASRKEEITTETKVIEAIVVDRSTSEEIGANPRHLTTAEHTPGSIELVPIIYPDQRQKIEATVAILSSNVVTTHGQQFHDAMEASITPETLVRHKSYLEEIIDPDNGLLEDLLRSGTITAKDNRDINDEHSYHNRNAKLLDYINEPSKCEPFVTSLRNTKQKHIVNYLASDGEYRSEFGSDWPPTKQHLKILDANKGALVDLIDSDALLSLLLAKKVISKMQKDGISSEMSPQKRKEASLVIFRRMSAADYNIVINCLRESERHVAQILEGGGVISRVHVETNATAEEERILADILTKILGDKPEEARRRIWNMMECNIIAAKAKAGQSVVLYASCKTQKEAQTLEILLESEKFKDLAQQLFDHLLHRSRKVSVERISVSEEELAHIKERSNCHDSLTMTCIPFLSTTQEDIHLTPRHNHLHPKKLCAAEPCQPATLR